jgi:hypothetical protein
MAIDSSSAVRPPPSPGGVVAVLGEQQYEEPRVHR